MAIYNTQHPKEEIINLSKELQCLWKDFGRYKRKYDRVTQYVWWRQHEPRIRQIQSRVNKLRIQHMIPCYRTKGGKKRVFFPIDY